jgi:hypothetical protein
MSSPHDREHLDDLLDRSAPPTTVQNSAIMYDLHELEAAAREASKRPAKHSRWSRPTIAGVVALLLVGGATTAVAAGWRPDGWVHPVVGNYGYTLPSGTVCDMIVGNVQGSDPESMKVMGDFYRDADYAALLSDDAIATRIEKIRDVDVVWALDENGEMVPGGYGTLFYDADEEYESAVSQILSEAAEAEIADAGLTGVDPNLTYEGRRDCGEAVQ